MNAITCRKTIKNHENSNKRWGIVDLFSEKYMNFELQISINHENLLSKSKNYSDLDVSFSWFRITNRTYPAGSTYPKSNWAITSTS